jgi:hypothetical protein
MFLVKYKVLNTAAAKFAQLCMWRHVLSENMLGIITENSKAINIIIILGLYKPHSTRQLIQNHQ